MNKSKNWKDALLNDCYSLKVFKREDGGFSIKYSCLDGLKDLFISERFEVDEKVIIRVIRIEVIQSAYNSYIKNEVFKEHVEILKSYLNIK